MSREHHVPDAPAHPSDPTTSELPKHRRGGQELPDEMQDRPEQNAGYDAAVRGESTDEEDRDENRSADGDVEREREEDSRNDADVESDEPQHRPH